MLTDATNPDYTFDEYLGYYEEDYVWRVYWNELAEGGPRVGHLPPDYDVPDLTDRAPNLIDRVTVITWDESDS